MAVSIEDVAREANVSISTVSRVLNRKSIVNVQTRKRVEDAIRKLGYRPNVFARGLMLRRSNILGLVLPDLHGEFFSEVIRGANRRANELGYHLMISSLSTNEDGESLLSSVFAQGLVDGAAVLVSHVDENSRNLLDSVTIPVVVLNGSAEEHGHDRVVIDQSVGAEAMMRHLIEDCRCQRVVYVGGPAEDVDSAVRLEAYRATMQSAGLSVGAEDVHHLDYHYESAFELGRKQVANWSAGGVCVIAANDEMAAGIINAAIEAGVSVPRQICVVGFDDTRVARMTRPRLTTVRVPMSEMGASAVELLCSRLEDEKKPAQTVTLQSELVVRDSCGIVAS